MAIGTPTFSTQQFRTSEGSTAVNMPATVNAGDFLFIWGRVNGVAAVTTPGSWTAVVSFNRHGNAPNIFFAYKTAFADGTEGGTTVSVTHTNNISTWIAGAVSGVDTGTPIDVTPVTGDTSTADNSSSLSGYTTTVAGCLGVFMASQSGTTATSTPPSAPAAWTEQADNTAGSNVGTLCTLAGLASGSQGTVANTWSASLQHIEAIFALRPAGGTTWNADAAQTVTATQAAAVNATHSVDAAQTATATSAATVNVVHPVDATQTVTATQAASIAAVHPVDAAQSGTATQAAAINAVHPVTAAQTVTAAQLAALNATHPVDAAQVVTATQAAALTVTTGGTTWNLDAPQTLTATQAATVNAVHPIDVSQTVTATQAAATLVSRPIAATQSVTATQLASVNAAHPVDASQTVTASQLAALTVTPASGAPGSMSTAPTGVQMSSSASPRGMTSAQAPVAAMSGAPTGAGMSTGPGNSSKMTGG